MYGAHLHWLKSETAFERLKLQQLCCVVNLIVGIVHIPITLTSHLKDSIDLLLFS